MAAQVPETLAPLLSSTVLATLATVRSDGAPAIAHVWVDYVDGHILTSSPLGSRKGRNIRAEPRVAMDVVDPADPWRYLQLRGHVVEIRPDDDLLFIDRLSRRYRGVDYAVRDEAREIYVIEIDQVKAAGA